jgi:hypothetical protein
MSTVSGHVPARARSRGRRGCGARRRSCSRRSPRRACASIALVMSQGGTPARRPISRTPPEVRPLPRAACCGSIFALAQLRRISLGVVGAAPSTFVFGARDAGARRGARTAARSRRSSVQHLRLARALAREVEQAAGPAAAQQAEAMTRGRGGLAEAGRRDEQRVVGASRPAWSRSAPHCEPFRPRFLGTAGGPAG